MHFKSRSAQEVFPAKMHTKLVQASIPQVRYEADRDFRIRDPEIGERLRLRKKQTLTPDSDVDAWLMRLAIVRPDQDNQVIYVIEVSADGTFNENHMIVLAFTAEMLMFTTVKRFLRKKK